VTTPPTAAANTKTSHRSPHAQRHNQSRKPKAPPRNPAPAPPLPHKRARSLPKFSQTDRSPPHRQQNPTHIAPSTRDANRPPARAHGTSAPQGGGGRPARRWWMGATGPRTPRPTRKRPPPPPPSPAETLGPPRALPPSHDELGAESLRLKKMNKDWWGRLERRGAAQR
jgi:hypothetical protein